MYNEPQKVRANNGQEFIDEFKRARQIMSYSKLTGKAFVVRKLDVWNYAKNYKIRYTMELCPFVVKRIIMTIL